MEFQCSWSVQVGRFRLDEGYKGEFQTNLSRFPYPVTTTFVQLSITSLLVFGASRLTRLTGYYESLELEEAPDSEENDYLCPPVSSSIHSRKNSIVQHVNPQIAGLTRLGWREAREVFPLAIVFLMKVLLENLFITYITPSTIADAWD